MESRTRIAIMQAISRLGAFIPEEVIPEVRFIDKVRVSAQQVRQVMHELAGDGIIEEREGDVGPKRFWKVRLPEALAKKIDVAGVQ